ncbi:translation factor SUA5 [Hasllibacter halocynthiae]|uniref:Threonylcarbamoyl-AMP synthase n=1 Tax=Hasllibacter halocynthiae TaxID=595589 RepID=A0A2T0X3U6_9RHOB|nr:L-threonylcarbamoyladenylate synthase [Hasllibacter halocynthiae]PRY93611.1 translation factor SUA5 [Hasllibacter halocynthiae]
MGATQLLKPDAAGIEAGAAILRSGGLVAFPTETVYGLGARADDDRAVARIFEAKGRPTFNPLICHVSAAEDAFSIGRLDDRAGLLAAAFWPGPLTLVAPHRAGVSDLARASLGTVGLRVPGHPVARALIEAAGVPVAAPSANPSGRISPTAAAHVLEGLEGRIDAVFDAGPCPVGVESTIVACTGGPPRLLREGGVPREALERVAGPLGAGGGGAVEAPGMTLSHYAPRGAVRLDADAPRAGERMLGFGAVGGEANLSPSGDLGEAAANLFAMMRALDDGRPLAVAPIPDRGLGRAIRDRLTRAAAPQG